MEPRKEQLVYALSVGVYHCSDFGHRMELWHGSVPRKPHCRELGRWKGLGIPEQVYTDALTVVHATLGEHLLTRYGIAGELPLKWGGEPDPF
jgi:hypothetical protein